MSSFFEIHGETLPASRIFNKNGSIKIVSV